MKIVEFLHDFKYLDGQEVSPSIPYHIMYLNDGKEVYVTEADFDENKSEVIVRYSGETDYKEYVRSKDGGNWYNGFLDDMITKEIHALQLKTLTCQQCKKQN